MENPEKKKTSVVNHLENKEQEDTLSWENVRRVQKGEALTNSLVLQETFRNLSMHDLKACSKVSSLWESEVDFCLEQFNVEFCYSVFSQEESFSVRKIKGLMGDSEIHKLTNFVELNSMITQATKRISRPYIALSLYRFKIDDTKLTQFLENFGHLVFRLNYNFFDYAGLREFCLFLWKYLPNLEELHMDLFSLEYLDDEPMLVEQEKKLLESLKTISFFKSNPSNSDYYDLTDEPFLEILKMAPNLQIIETFPAEKAHILTWTGKSDLVQKCQFLEKRHRMDFVLEYLSNLQPHLTSFELPRCSHTCPAKMFRHSKVYLTAILESSKETLENLIIFPTQRHSYVDFPCGMTALRVLELVNESNHFGHTNRQNFNQQQGLRWRRPKRRFFRSNVNLRNKFPNVQEIKISLEGIAPDNVFKYFADTTFQDLQIKRLHLNQEASLCLENLSKVFSSVDTLTIDITYMTIREIPSIIKNMSKFPCLKCVRLELNSHQFFMDPDIPSEKRGKHEGLFDSILTGIPEETCEILRKVVLEDVEKYRTKESLLGIEGLEKLEFIFNNKLPSRWWRSDWIPILFSEVSAKYGLRIYPHVAVSVRVEDEHPKIDREMMVKAVGGVLEEIELDMAYKP